MRTVVMVVLVISFALPVMAQDTRFSAPPVCSVPRVAQGPNVDGIIEQAEWAKAAPLSPFVLVGGKGQPANRTAMWVMYDAHNLYVAAILYDPDPGTLKANATERDGAVWEDDSLELFFDTEDQRKSYIHLAVNPAGTQYDSLMKDQSADYRWRAQTGKLAEGWMVELELPFANDFPPAPGISWGFSAGRHSARSNELSSWDRKLKSFHELADFGSLTFADSPLAMDLAALGRMWLGESVAQVVLSNFSPQPADCKLNVRVMGRDRHGHFFSATKVTVPGASRQSQNVPFSIYQDGFSTVAFSLTDAQGKTVWRSSPYAVVTPEVSPQIAAIEQALGAGTRAWLMLPDSDTKKNLQENLDALTVQWRYLTSQYKNRQKMERTDLETLGAFADKLKGEAEMLQKQIQSARTSSKPAGRFAAAAVSSSQHVFPDDFSFEAQPVARLDLCRNETESAQVVVLPFR